MKTMKLILSLILILSITTSCSVSLLNYSILSKKEINIQNSGGIKVSGYSNAWFKSQRKAVEEATENALNKAGENYDLLLNGTIEAEYKIFYTRIQVKGTAYKSSDLMNKYGKVGFEKWKKEQNLITKDQITTE